MKHHRYSTGLLVTLRPLFDGDDGGDPGEVVVADRIEAGVAYHHPVPCALNETCLRLWPNGVTQMNILAVLKHEELHHTFLRIGEDDAMTMLDNIMPTVQHTCRMLGCTNHQIFSGVSA